MTGIEHAQVLDLSDDGERWEGDVLNNQPYGWGVLYDSENRMVYYCSTGRRRTSLRF